MKYFKKIIFLGVVLFLPSLISYSFVEEKGSENSVGPIDKGMKLGILVNNSIYKIYRTKNLGEDGLEDLEEYTKEKGLVFPKTIISMNHWGYKFPSYSSMEEYQLKEKYDYKFYHSFGHGERTYLDGYNPYYPTVDIDTTAKLGRKARKIFELRNDGIDGGIDNFFKILRIVLDTKNQPVLFHCFGGRHRTGMIAMALRYMQGGKWTNGFYKEKKGIRMNLAQYEYYKFNRSLFRKENLEFIEQVKDDPRFIELKIQYGELLQ